MTAKKKQTKKQQTKKQDQPEAPVEKASPEKQGPEPQTEQEMPPSAVDLIRIALEQLRKAPPAAKTGRAIRRLEHALEDLGD